MAKTSKSSQDTDVPQVNRCLQKYRHDYPKADVKAYRQNPASIRIRIVDDHFAGMSRRARHDEVWAYLSGLTQDILQQITMLLLLPTAELRSSLANLEFEDPVSSQL